MNNLDNHKQINPTVQTMKEQLGWITGKKLEDLDFSILNKRFTSLSGDPDIAYMDLYTNSNGTEILDSMVGTYQPGLNGQWFRLAKVGASALVTANVLQSSVRDAQFVNMAVLATAIAGAAQVQVGNITNGTTTVNIGDYVNGSVTVYTTPDFGNTYMITGHNTPTSGNALTVYLDRPLRTAWTTSTKVVVKRNPWSGVIQAPATTLTGIPVGFAVFAATASTAATTTSEAAQQYAWVQTHGITSGLSDATTIIQGSQVASPSGTAGAITLGVAGLPPVGVALEAAASAHAIPLFASID